MKIVLLEPPPLSFYGNQRSKGAFGNLKTDIRWPPIDLIVLAGYLRKEGFRCDVVDAGAERLKVKAAIRRILDCSPDMIIVNTSTTTLYSDLRVIENIRAELKNALIGCIGVHVMALPEETLESCASLDFVVFTEPEIPILNILRNKGDMKGIDGIVYRTEGNIVRNKKQGPLMDLDQLGIPAHDAVPLALYREPQMKRRPMTVTMVSRGCVNRCSFCSSVFYGAYRLRSVDSVMEELRWITKKLGVRELKFYDNAITYQKQWAVALFEEMIKGKIDLSWNANIRVDSIDCELAGLMKRAGCHTVNFGLETAEQSILDAIGKNATVEKAREAIAIAKEEGLEVCGYFAFGLPKETIESMRKTVSFALETDLDLATFNIATPHPGSAFYNFLIENKYLLTTQWDLYDTNSMPVYSYPHLPAEQIYRAASKAYKDFYLRPRYIKKRLLRIASVCEAENAFRNAAAFIRNFVFR